MLLPCRIDHARTAIPFREKSAKVYSREPHDPTPPTPRPRSTFLAYRPGHLTRRGHRPPSIERHLPEQAAMFISPMSALERITDSSQSSRRVRKVPPSDSCSAHSSLSRRAEMLRPFSPARSSPAEQ